MLAIAGDNGQFLAMLAESVELVGEGGLELFAGDVGQLGLCDQRLGFGTDQLLLEDDYAGRVGLLVLELGDLIGDFLLAVSAGLDGGFDIADALDGDTILVVAVDELVFELANFVDQDTEFVGNVGDVVITSFTPDGQLLLRMVSRLPTEALSLLNLQPLPFSRDRQAPCYA